MTTDTFDRLTRDDRWQGFGYLGGRQHEDPELVADADARILALTEGWTEAELFAWANSKWGRWFADSAFGGYGLDEATQYLRKVELNG